MPDSVTQLEAAEPDPAGDPVMAAMRTLAAHAAAERDAACVARLDGSRGRLVVGDDDSVAGSLGDPVLNAGAVELASESLLAATSRIGRVRDAAGAEVELFAERYAAPETLVIFGASEVAVALVPLAASIGWRTVVVDGPEEREARTLRFGARTAVVLVAQDHRVELSVLGMVLDSDAAYVGLLGSRRRVDALLDALADEGLPSTALARVHAPVGLDLGARTPAEIALAIVAEALATLRGRSGGSLRTPAAVAPASALPIVRETAPGPALASSPPVDGRLGSS